MGGSEFCLSTVRGILCLLFPGYFNPYLSPTAEHRGLPCGHRARSLHTGHISEDAHARRILMETPGRWVSRPAGRLRQARGSLRRCPAPGLVPPRSRPDPLPPAPAPRSLCRGQRPRLRRSPSPGGNPATPGCGSSPGAAPGPAGERSVCGPGVEQGGEGRTAGLQQFCAG